MRGCRPKHGYCPEFIFPVSEEVFLVEETDIPASPIPPETARPAEPEVEAATILPLQSHVLPEQETGIVSSSPCVRRVRLSSKTTLSPDSPFNVTATPVGVNGKAPCEPSENGDLGWWLGLDEEAKIQ